MRLTTLAFSNIRHNIKNYTMYFFAMCFCVFTAYSFANLALSETVYNHIIYSQNYRNMFVGFGIVIMIFVLFFLITSNNSFIRYRKKEISTYALFGMSNAKIGRLLFFETMIIGITAFILGIALGVLFSKLIVMILFKMVLAEYSYVKFSIGVEAIIITAAAYCIIFCLMGLSGYRTINKFQLIDLFKGDRVSEKRTRGSYIMLIISILLIVAGYYMAINENPFKVIAVMLLVIGMVILGSYLFFTGGLQKLLYLFKKDKSFFYKKSRLISISLLSHKAKTLAMTMGTIAVLIATSVTAMAFGYTLYKSAENNANEINSFDIWYYADNEGLEGKIYDLLEEYNSEPIDSIKFQRYISYPELDNLINPPVWLQFGEINLMTYRQSEFNGIVNSSKDSNEIVETKKGTAFIIYPDNYTSFEYEDPKLIYGDIVFDLEFIQRSNPYTFGGAATVVFEEEDYKTLYDKGYISKGINNDLWPFVGINYKNALSSRALARELTELLSDSDNVGSYRILYNTYIESMELFGLVCFIGYFICAVFILMSVSLLYFKQVAIGTEEVSQYEKLRKIGLDKQQEQKVIRNRIAPVFFIPLFMGLLHSLFAMKGADTIIFSSMLISQGNTYLQVLKMSSVMYAVYAIIYFGFYLITKYKYTTVVSGK